MNTWSRSQQPRPYTRKGNSEYEFDPTAKEVAILDRSGRAIWKKIKTEQEAANPIRWSGTDAQGHSVETGDYICKISYENEKVAYLPFVFMKRF